MSVRVRFAPSPTGYLHVGGARTALYNYLFAKKHGGTFVLRIEDTDLARSTEESLRMQIGDLQWLGLHWDEGPDAETLKDKGAFGPYRQSQRLAIYKEHAERLLERGLAYYDFRTDAELEKAKEEAIAQGLAHQVPRPTDIVPLEEARRRIAAGETAAIKFWLKEDKVHSFRDLVRGDVTFPPGMLGDFVLLRSNGMPVYNFCNVIDDALMEITHVFRAEEHLSNTLRQLILYKAFGYKIPEFGHLSIILGPDRQKLSKRHGATSCNEYRESGFLPEALNNFVALLGWSSPEAKEILTMDEMIAQFSTERLNPAAAVFDETKLKWMNAMHLRALSNEDLWSEVEPFLQSEGLRVEGDKAWRDKALNLFKTSMETLKDAVALFRPTMRGGFEIFDEGREALGWETTPLVLRTWIEELQKSPHSYLSSDEFLKIQDTVKEIANVKGKQLFMPIRVAVIGKPHGAELKDLIPLIQKEILIERAEKCLGR